MRDFDQLSGGVAHVLVQVAIRRAGRKAEHFAEATGRYTDIAGALRALMDDCNVLGLSDNAHETQLQLL